MKHDKAATDAVKVDDVVQIDPSVHDNGGAFAVVAEKHSWGCRVIVRGYGALPIAWKDIEPVGRAVWDGAGARIKPAESTLKHHP